MGYDSQDRLAYTERYATIGSARPTSNHEQVECFAVRVRPVVEELSSGMRNIRRSLLRIRAWFKSLKPGSEEEILSWDFGPLAEEPEARPEPFDFAQDRRRRRVGYNRRRSGDLAEHGQPSIAVPLDSSQKDVLDVVRTWPEYSRREELREETKPVLEIFHLSQTVPTDEGPVEVLQGFSLQVKQGPDGSYRRGSCRSPAGIQPAGQAG